MRKYKKIQSRTRARDRFADRSKRRSWPRMKGCNDLTANDANQRTALQNQIDALNKQIDFLKQNHDATLKQLQDLRSISGSQAESIKKSLDNIGSKDTYIRTSEPTGS